MRRSPQKRFRSLILGTAVFAILVLGGSAVFSAVRNAGRQFSCSMTLAYEWGGGIGLFRTYAYADPEKKYPPLCTVPGVFFPALESVIPFMEPERIYSLHCRPAEISRSDPDLAEKYYQPSYVYFGYALADEDQILAFLESYPAFLESGANFDEDLPAPEGRGSFGGNQFLRLRIDLTTPDGSPVHSLPPVLFDVPLYEDGKMQFRHGGKSGQVLYGYGHHRLIEYGIAFPMTPAVFEKIREVSVRFEADAGDLHEGPSERPN